MDESTDDSSSQSSTPFSQDNQNLSQTESQAPYGDITKQSNEYHTPTNDNYTIISTNYDTGQTHESNTISTAPLDVMVSNSTDSTNSNLVFIPTQFNKTTITKHFNIPTTVNSVFKDGEEINRVHPTDIIFSNLDIKKSKTSKRQQLNDTLLTTVTTQRITTTTFTLPVTRRPIVEFKAWMYITAGLAFVILIICLTLYFLRARIWRSYYDNLAYNRVSPLEKPNTKTVINSAIDLQSLKVYDYYFAYDNPYEEFNFYLSNHPKKASFPRSLGQYKGPNPPGPSGKFRIPSVSPTKKVLTPKHDDNKEEDDDSDEEQEEGAVGENEGRSSADSRKSGTPSHQKNRNVSSPHVTLPTTTKASSAIKNVNIRDSHKADIDRKAAEEQKVLLARKGPKPLFMTTGFIGIFLAC